MTEFMHRETAEVKTQGEWRKHYRNVSLPKVWTIATTDSLKLEAILKTPKPAHGPYQSAVRNGVTQDALGNWVEGWLVVGMFADTTDEEGVVTTKAAHEANYQAGLDASVAASIRSQRNTLITETDFHALTDVTMSAETTTYRQALRDVTSQAGFPNNITWPTKP